MAKIIQLIDSNTRESVNFEEVTTWHDGTVMNNSKVDNVIYRKKDGKYYADCNYLAGSDLNIRRFGVLGEKNQDTNIVYEKILNALVLAKKFKRNLYFPAGVYNVGVRNFPFSHFTSIPEEQLTELYDFNDITIYGDSRSTIFMTDSQTGADVVQLNALKNIHFRDIAITANVATENMFGSNAISVTNGFDNMTFRNIYCFDLLGVNRPFPDGRYPDGGKAFTIQCGDTDLYKGSVRANIIANNCMYGFTLDNNSVSTIMNRGDSAAKIDLEIDVDRACFGIHTSYGTPNMTFDSHKGMILNVNANLVNCQKAVVLARQVGGNFNINIQNTLSKNELAKRKDGKNWLWGHPVGGYDKESVVLLNQASKNIDLKIEGFCNEVDKKIWMGAVGETTESHSYLNACENSRMLFDIRGTAVQNMHLITKSVVGTDIQSCFIVCSEKTCNIVDFPYSLFSISKGNIIIIGQTYFEMVKNVYKTVFLNTYNGYYSYIQQGNIGLEVRQMVASSDSIPILSTKDFDTSKADNGNQDRHVFYNDGSVKIIFRNNKSGNYKNADVLIFAGENSPENIEAAPPGSFFIRVDYSGDTRTTADVFFKKSGTGTTGWERLEKKASAQPDSTAADIPSLVNDFNALLSKLRIAGLMN